MEALTTAAAAVSPPMLSLNKSRNPSFRRLLSFAAAPQKSNDDSSSSSSSSSNTNDLKSDSSSSALVPILSNRTISKDEAMGLVLSAANVRGWTTGSGMEGPPVPAGSDPDSGTERVSTFPWSLFTKSPRRRMRVAFTCSFCGQRTTRAINPHAYTDGSVFVQCCGCNIYHKLVDNLNLFDEVNCYVSSSFNPNPDNGMSFKYFDSDEDKDDDIFPVL